MSEAGRQELYGGTVILDRDGRHRYRVLTVNGETMNERVPSGTGISGLLDKSGPISGWAVNEMEKFLLEHVKPGKAYTPTELKGLFRRGKRARYETKDQAADLGTDVHSWAESFLAGEEPDLPKDKRVLTGVEAFRRWWDRGRFEVLYLERFVYSVEHHFTGQTDLVLWDPVNKRFVVGDLKTSNGIYDEYQLQVSGYDLALEEEGVVEDARRLLIHLDKGTGMPEEYDLDFLHTKDPTTYMSKELARAGFLGLRAAFLAVKGF